MFETSECFLVQNIHSKTEQNDFSLSMSGQVAVAIRFLTRLLSGTMNGQDKLAKVVGES